MTRKQIYILWSIFILSTLAVFIAWRDYEDYYRFTSLYSQGRYNEILDTLSASSPEMLHNLWNTAFWQFLSWPDSVDIEYLQSAVEYYSGSLNIDENKDTRYNYELSKSMLDLLSEQQEWEQEEAWENNPQWEWEQKESEDIDENDENASGQQDEQQESQTDTSPTSNRREDQYRLWEDKDIQEITQQEFEQLQETIEEIKRDQVNNQRFYDKKPQDTGFQSLFDNFLGNIDRWWEKDW